MPCFTPCTHDIMVENGYFTPDVLKIDLVNSKPLLLLDCRSQVDFNESHIIGAINITLPNLMFKRLMRGTLNIACVIQSNEAREKFSKCSLTHTVLLYDQFTSDLLTNPTCVLSLLFKKLQQDGTSVSFLVGGFSTFQSLYPELCIVQDESSAILGLRNLKIADESCSNDDNGRTPPQLSPFPVKVLPFLYLGNAKNSADLTLLRTFGIHYILNVTPNVPNMFEEDGSFKYMQIPIDDHWSQNLSIFFDSAITFIDEARQNNSAVLVHCLAGVSRSVTVTVAYLMRERRMTLNAAYDFVKRCKPNISPNFNFMGQLLDFEQSLGLDRSGADDKTSTPAAPRSGSLLDGKREQSPSECGSAKCGLTSLDDDLLRSACCDARLDSMLISSSSASSDASPNDKTVAS